MTADMVCPPSLLQEEANPNSPLQMAGQIARRFITTKHISGMLETSCLPTPRLERFYPATVDVNEINRQGV